MIDLIESLPKKEKEEFLKTGIHDLIGWHQSTLNALSVSFATAIALEPDMMQSQAEAVRCSLIWLDSNLVDLRAMLEDYERKNTYPKIG